MFAGKIPAREKDLYGGGTRSLLVYFEYVVFTIQRPAVACISLVNLTTSMC